MPIHRSWELLAGTKRDFSVNQNRDNYNYAVKQQSSSFELIYFLFGNEWLCGTQSLIEQLVSSVIAIWWPYNAFDPIQVSVDTCIDRRRTMCLTAPFSERGHADYRMHALYVRMFYLNRFARDILQIQWIEIVVEWVACTGTHLAHIFLAGASAELCFRINALAKLR